jgi:hypothetical protein
MTQRQGNERQEKFEYSEAALDEYYASRRRYIRPVLVLFATMLLFFPTRRYEVAALAVVGVGGLVFFVMIGQNYRVERRADKRMKAENREWEAKQARPM